MGSVSLEGRPKTKSRISVRPMLADDAERYVDLCRTRDALAGGKAWCRTDVVNWLNVENPVARAQELPCIFVAEQGERIVGHIGHMPTLFQIGNQRVLASFWHDLYVHPELRKNAAQGFFTSRKLYRAIEQTSPNFAAMIWTNQINIELQRSRKYEERWFDHYIKRLDLDDKIDEKLPGALTVVGKRVVGAAMDIVDRGVHAVLGRGAGEVFQVSRADERFDELAQRVGPLMGIAPVKDAAYLNWKYFDRPHVEVACFAASAEDGGLSGYVVIAWEGDSAFIADVSAAPQDLPTLYSLFGAAHRHLREIGHRRVDCVATAPWLKQALRKMLYIQRPPRMPLFFYNRAASAYAGRIGDVNAWHLCYGDSEGPF